MFGGHATSGGRFHHFRWRKIHRSLTVDGIDFNMFEKNNAVLTTFGKRETKG